MSILSNILCFLFLSTAIAGSGKGAHVKSKSIKKTYTVNKDAIVKLENSFGSMTISTWDKPEVIIEINVEVDGKNEDDVNEKLEEINVIFKSSASRVTAMTEVEKNNSGWNLFKGSSKLNFKIDYIVHMPVTASLDASNDYGAITLDKLEGHAQISCDFGRLQIGQLLHKDNKLSFDYTNNSHIDYMKSGRINADFSSFTLYGTDDVEFNGDYSTAKIEQAINVNFKSDFSTVSIDQSKTIICRGDYSTIKVGTLMDKGNFNTDFGSIKIKDLKAGFKELTVKSDYTGIDIYLDENASTSVVARTEYGSIKLDDTFNVTRSKSDGIDKLKEAYLNEDQSGNMIDINSSFGSVKIMTK